jgi:hypothetical protein
MRVQICRGGMIFRSDGKSHLRLISKSTIDLESLKIGDCPYFLLIR